MLHYLTDILPVVLRFLQILLQIGMLYMLIYIALLFLRGTRAEVALVGIVLIIFFGWIFAQLLGLEELQWLLEQLPTLLAFGLIIVFHPELRRAFAEIGSNPYRLWRGDTRRTEIVDALVEAAFHLSKKKLGALIVIERDIGMRTVIEGGVRLDARLTAELISTIFYKDTPLHDGAIVIRSSTLVAANCILPLTHAPISRYLGTRHRAGIGITEETDAVVIVVSEERHTVGIAHMGMLVQDIGPDRLRRHLTNYLVKGRRSSRGLIKQGVDKVKDVVANPEETDGTDEVT
jgi:diadenylate cyclase